jgi:hypothetical protein
MTHVVCLLVEVAALFMVKICESTMGEYIRTQQALTMGHGVNGEAICGGGE